MHKIKVLFLAAYPDVAPLQLDEEIRAITQKIRLSEFRETLDLVSAWAVRPDDLIQTLNQHRPHIVHFSGHGSPSGEIILVDENLVDNKRVPKAVSPAALKALFQTFQDNVRIVFLNACYTLIQAEALRDVVDCVIGMTSGIGDQAAIKFAASFYRALGFGRSVKEAFDQGKVALLLDGIPEDKIPVLLHRADIDPSELYLLQLSSGLPDASVAARIISFLEGRRVLYGPLYKNCPGGIIQTIKPIRDKISSELENLDRNSNLYRILADMRWATLEFLNYVCRDCPSPESCDDCSIPQIGCADGLVEYRKKMGVLIAEISHIYNIGIEGELAFILPASSAYGDMRRKKPSFGLLKELFNEVALIKNLDYYHPDFQKWHSSVKAILREIFGEDAYYVREYDKIPWHTSDEPEREEQQRLLFQRSCIAAEGLLAAIISRSYAVDGKV